MNQDEWNLLVDDLMGHNDCKLTFAHSTLNEQARLFVHCETEEIDLILIKTFNPLEEEPEQYSEDEDWTSYILGA